MLHLAAHVDYVGDPDWQSGIGSIAQMHHTDATLHQFCNGLQP